MNYNILLYLNQKIYRYAKVQIREKHNSTEYFRLVIKKVSYYLFITILYHGIVH